MAKDSFPFKENSGTPKRVLNRGYDDLNGHPPDNDEGIPFWTSEDDPNSPPKIGPEEYDIGALGRGRTWER